MIALTALLLAPAPPSPARPVAMRSEGDGARVSFDREVRPLLSDRCFECHGPDARAREAGLRLDSREGLLGEDGAAGVVVPGAPEESLLVQRITAPDPLDRMPPPGSRHRPSADAWPCSTGSPASASRRWASASVAPACGCAGPGSRRRW